MPYTENCDLYLAVSEDAFNRVFRHILTQNPPLFNYGTPYFVQHPDEMCYIPTSGPPRAIAPVNPVEIPNADPATVVEYCYQLSDATIDFHPLGAIADPPPGWNISQDQMAIRLEFHAGVLKPTDPTQGQKTCFEVKLFSSFRMEIRPPSSGSQFLVARLVDTEIVDIGPDSFETMNEWFLETIVRRVLIPRVQFDLRKLEFEVGELATIRLAPAAGVNPVPQIRDNELRMFFDAEVE